MRSKKKAGEYGLPADDFEGLNRFKTTSDEVILVIAGMVPINFLAKEMNMLYHAGHIKGHTKPRNVRRSESNYLC